MDTLQKNKYYTSVGNYSHIKELRDSILNLHKGDAELMAFIQIHDIPVNCYVHDKNLWVPLVFMCMRFKERQGLVKYLLKHGANVKLQPDGVDNILITCHSCYLQYLTKAGCTLSNIDTYIMRQLRGGSVCRLQQLIKLGILHVSDIDKFMGDHPNIMQELAETMVKYLFYAFNLKTNVENKKDELNRTIDMTRESLKFVISSGAVLHKEYVTYCASYYLHEFLEDIDTDMKYACVVPYHPHMPGEVVSMLRPLLNDYRYVKTCETCRVKPEEDVYLPVGAHNRQK